MQPLQGETKNFDNLGNTPDRPFLIPIDAEDLELLERYYLEEIAQAEDYRRRDLETLLNNWTKEIDRATSHFATPAIR